MYADDTVLFANNAEGLQKDLKFKKCDSLYI